jgi:hypothetical protein
MMIANWQALQQLLIKDITARAESWHPLVSQDSKDADIALKCLIQCDDGTICTKLLAEMPKA